MPRLIDGVNPKPRHPDIVPVRCPFCGHDSAFDKSLDGFRYRCSRCQKRFNIVKTEVV